MSGTVIGPRNTASPLHTKKFCSESTFVKSNEVSLGTQLTVGSTVLCCDRFIILFTQITHKNQTKKENILNLTVQPLEKDSSPVQQLACRGWHRVNRPEELLTGGGRAGGRWWS